MAAKPNSTPGAHPAGEDFWARWGVWVAIGALGVAVVAGWLTGFLGTNSRIDALYPTILQQTKDIDAAGAKIDAAQASLTAAAAQNAELVKKLADLQAQETAMLATQQDQVANIKDIKQAIGDLTNSISSRFDRLDGRIDKINSSPIKKTEFLEGSYVFASPTISEKYARQLKESGVASIKVLKFDDPTTSGKIIEAWKEIPEKSNFFWLTKDAPAAEAFMKILGQ